MKLLPSFESDFFGSYGHKRTHFLLPTKYSLRELVKGSNKSFEKFQVVHHPIHQTKELENFVLINHEVRQRATLRAKHNNQRIKISHFERC